ncbi:right-handed parallel beta-helix repeat-containing protein [Paenibacillus contaminans]|nr:right-handed parallel beta-helix repeat-containing protein [Paenibacillus contaminans]
MSQNFRENESFSNEKPDVSISRRKLLSTLGVAGAALAAGGILGGGSMRTAFGEGATVTEAVYGNGNDACTTAPCVIAVTLSEMRTSLTPDPACTYYVKDSGQEGFFLYDPADTATQDDNGLTIVSSAGARYKRTAVADLNLKWFGAKGDNAADDTQAVQAAVAAAQQLGMAVYAPAGTYLISAPIVLDSAAKPIRISGDGVYTTFFKPHPDFTEANPLEAIFKFNDTLVANRYEFAEFGIVSGQLLDPKRMRYGIYSTKLSHTAFRRLCIQGTQTAALGIGYGWCNDIDSCEFSFNSGDGLLFTAGQLNALNVVNTKIFANAGIGINMAYEGLEVRIQGCTIEKNAACGIYVKKGSFNLSIYSCYFEGNAETGLTFTNPAMIVKASIILNGNVSATEPQAIQNRYPSQNVTITDNFVSVGSEDYFVAGYAVEIGLEIRKNTFLHSGTVREYTLLRTGTNKTGLGAMAKGIIIRDNDVPSNYKPYLNLKTLAIDNVPLSDNTGFHTSKIRHIPRVNYSPALSSFVKIRDFGRPGVFGSAAQQYRQKEVYSFTGEAVPDQWGFSIDLAQYPELAGVYMYFGLYVKQSAANMNTQLFITGTGANTQGYGSNTAWRITSSIVKMPDTGIVNFCVGMIADSAAKTLYIAHPVLSEIGVPYDYYF